MAQAILGFIDFVVKNFAGIESTIVYIALAVYLVYGIALAADGSKRFKSQWAPLMVFIGWCLFSIAFLPIYLIARPDIGARDKLTEDTQSKALLLGSNLDICPNCGDVTERFYKFCQKCGAQVVKVCPQCNQPMAMHWKFCVNCGQDMEPETKQERLNFAKIFNLGKTKQESMPDLAAIVQAQATAAAVEQAHKGAPTISSAISNTDGKKEEKPVDSKKDSEQNKKHKDKTEEKTEPEKHNQEPVEENVKVEVKDESPLQESDNDKAAKFEQKTPTISEATIVTEPQIIEFTPAKAPEEKPAEKIPAGTDNKKDEHQKEPKKADKKNNEDDKNDELEKELTEEEKANLRALENLNASEKK